MMENRKVAIAVVIVGVVLVVISLAQILLLTT